MVGKTGETITKLSETIAASATKATKISASSNQQAISVVELTEAIKNKKKLTKQTVSAAQQIEHAAKNLTTLSNELSDLTTS